MSKGNGSTRLEVSSERYRAETELVMEEALEREIAVIGEDGAVRLLIIRKLEPLD